MAHRPDAALPPASSVKIITALTAISTLPLDKVLTVQPPDLDTNNDTILEEGDQLAVRDALAALLVGSSNTAAKLLARHHSQGLPGFIAAMNDQAKLLGLSSTNLTNPIGLDQPGITSSARDLAIAAAALMDQPFLRQLVSSRDYSFNLINTGRQVTMTNTNQLLHQDPTVTGVKTGTTFLAGEVLVAQVERPAGSILVVVMGSQDRYAETQQLIDWTYRQYRWQPIDLTSYLVD
ncbi:MAG: hypothetical protein COU69_00380 [Candidatus Pacebacteria bacterium CG10_big_fil_rev_8_21_14_0_10_56_10]|nr:MAG: hypothetical protein COU69_00380 [Candidatus Pacebacteria bacterium CG10_big_fil_rev_8_21_14_0_10_56_10]